MTKNFSELPSTNLDGDASAILIPVWKDGLTQRISFDALTTEVNEHAAEVVTPRWAGYWSNIAHYNPGDAVFAPDFPNPGLMYICNTEVDATVSLTPNPHPSDDLTSGGGHWEILVEGPELSRKVIRNESGALYSLTRATDNFTYLRRSHSADCSMNIPPEADENWLIGDHVTVYNACSVVNRKLTLVPGVDVVINNKDGDLYVYAGDAVELVYVDENTWDLVHRREKTHNNTHIFIPDGVRVKSPNGTQWVISVNNFGSIGAAAEL